MSDAHRARVIDATQVLARRRRSGRRRRERIVVLGLIAVVLVTGLAWLFFGSGALRVEQVRVSGAGWLPVAQVEQAAQVPVGQAMASVSLSGIAERVSHLAPVHEVTVRRAWPHTIVIEVTLRTVAVQRQGTDGYQWVDAKGVVFWVSPKPQPGVIQVQTPDANQRLLRDAATVAGSLTGQLKAKTVRITLTSPDNIVLELSTKQRIEWGSAEDSATKAQVAAVLMTHPVTVINVSAPGRPTTR